jgi:carbon storage regulator
MLVLSRKPGEQIVVPELDLILTVISINGKKVRLGVSAPADISVHRRELWNRVYRPQLKSSPKG